jgi:hypothetical protein
LNGPVVAAIRATAFAWEFAILSQSLQDFPQRRRIQSRNLRASSGDVGFWAQIAFGSQAFQHNEGCGYSPFRWTATILLHWLQLGVPSLK